VAAILKNPDKTANKYLSVASFNVSIRDVIATIEKLTGQKYEVGKASSTDLQKQGEEKLAKGDYSAFRELVTVWCYADEAGHALTAETSANELLGLEEESLEDTVRGWLKKEGRL
jgi:hypothetical protein